MVWFIWFGGTGCFGAFDFVMTSVVLCGLLLSVCYVGLLVLCWICLVPALRWCGCLSACLFVVSVCLVFLLVCGLFCVCMLIVL